MGKAYCTYIMSKCRADFSVPARAVKNLIDISLFVRYTKIRLSEGKVCVSETSATQPT